MRVPFEMEPNETTTSNAPRVKAPWGNLRAEPLEQPPERLANPRLGQLPRRFVGNLVVAELAQDVLYRPRAVQLDRQRAARRAVACLDGHHAVLVEGEAENDPAAVA